MSATVTPAFITKEYLTAIREAGLLDRSDVAKIAAITQEMKSPSLNKGKGYGNEHIRNFLYRQCTTTPEMVNLIMGYFSRKKEVLAKTAAIQQSLVKELSEAHALHLTDKLS